MAAAPTSVNENDDDDDTDVGPFTTLLLPSPVALTAAQPELRLHHIPSINAPIQLRELPSQGLSFQLWPAASTLVSLLDTHCVFPTRRPLRILELGSGTGLVGIAAAAVLSAAVTLTDLSHVIPNLEFNVAANTHILENAIVEVAELEWGNEEQMKKLGSGFDMILGSDVVYHDHLFAPLIETLKYFMWGGGRERKVEFVMGHMKRWKKEGVFFKKMKKWFEMEVIYRETPQEGKRVGVVVYRFSAKEKYRMGWGPLETAFHNPILT